MWKRRRQAHLRPNRAASATSASAALGYMEFGTLHEIMHPMGIVSRAAPNHTLGIG